MTKQTVKKRKAGKTYYVRVSVTAGKETEYANIQAGRGILGYWIVSGTGELAPGADIVVNGIKLDFFRAFVDKTLMKHLP